MCAIEFFFLVFCLLQWRIFRGWTPGYRYSGGQCGLHSLAYIPTFSTNHPTSHIMYWFEPVQPAASWFKNAISFAISSHMGPLLGKLSKHICWNYSSRIFSNLLQASSLTFFLFLVCGPNLNSTCVIFIWNHDFA